MTNKPELTEGALTPEFIQELYSVAVSCEIDERSGAYMASFDLLCKADDAVGIAHVVRKLIDMVRANDVELQELRLNYQALRGEIEDVQAQLYEAENQANEYAAELQERRKADSVKINDEMAYAFHRAISDSSLGADEVEEIKNGLRAAFANVAAPQPAPVMNDELYKLANHVASSKNGLPEEWQDWAEELESEIRRVAMLQNKATSQCENCVEGN